MRTWIYAKTSEMTEEGLAYSIALILVVFALLTSKLNRYFNPRLSEALAYVAVAFLLYGFWNYLAPILKKASNSLVVKFLWTGLTITGVAVSLSLAQLLVNGILKVPASGFPHTQTIVAVLVSPFVLAIFALVIGLFLAPLFQIMFFSERGALSIKSFLSAQQPEARKSGAEVKYLGRFVALILVLGLCATGLSKNDAYLNGVGDFVRWFAFNFETERYSICSLDPEARVSYLTNDHAVVAIKDHESYKFQVIKCAVAR